MVCLVLICCSFAQSCPTLCDPMDYSTSGFPVLHHLLKFAQTHVHWVGDDMQPLILCHPPLLLPSIFPSMRVVSNESVLHIMWPKYWSYSSASVLPMNIQGWFPLGLTGWISFQSKGLSGVFSNTTVKKASIPWCSTLFMVQLLHPYMTTRKTMALTIQTFFGKVMSLLWICGLGWS